jgi:hypothetical protein
MNGIRMWKKIDFADAPKSAAASAISEFPTSYPGQYGSPTLAVFLLIVHHAELTAFIPAPFNSLISLLFFPEPHSSQLVLPVELRAKVPNIVAPVGFVVNSSKF